MRAGQRETEHSGCNHDAKMHSGKEHRDSVLSPDDRAGDRGIPDTPGSYARSLGCEDGVRGIVRGGKVGEGVTTKQKAINNMKFLQNTLAEVLAEKTSTAIVQYHVCESIECGKVVLAYLEAQLESGEGG